MPDGPGFEHTQAQYAEGIQRANREAACRLALEEFDHAAAASAPTYRAVLERLMHALADALAQDTEGQT